MTEIFSDSAYMIESLPEVWFGLVVFALGVYLLLDGFDFGLGILFAEADESDREVLLAAFGPLWKANEVWLVLFGTVLFAGFPAVYANILSRHYLLVFAILFALSCADWDRNSGRNATTRSGSASGMSVSSPGASPRPSYSAYSSRVGCSASRQRLRSDRSSSGDSRRALDRSRCSVSRRQDAGKLRDHVTQRGRQATGCTSECSY